ncbi:cytochrome D ubiquinol oxidase subunit I [Caldimicrobium thiodismutans]|jgi:cytochrome d ubiquinol oxidase subunit I|uniref:Cytochrome D ubiquinol oxidase subunit I n=1 Tax=Caldimicrobium thiodismutans TaxID=1653476 RepID=A0A0U5AXJ3_9BACT|nr:cytochrome ubiquinol oxidase subunit I [Caldimicrobium thiodismutans]BAU23358.1 cytochrome D ubiquinol oxidase subunit I [Caldimicrobium thiodismutans]
MDVLLASRLQFAAAAMFHFLFVPLTLGLSFLTAIFQTLWLKTGDDDYKRAARFWGKLFLINFGLGVVTGITLEFQFGTNWRFYSQYVGDIFGSLLAIEATLAFFLESTFIAVWWFGWGKVSPRVNTLAIWLTAIASNISALWILLANGWMQHPVGYVIRGGRAELESFSAVLTNSFAWWEFLHTVPSAYVLSGFFVLGVSAWHLIRKNELSLFKKSFRVAAIWTMIFSLYLIVEGHIHGAEVAEKQPTKLAAMESHWVTEKGAGWSLLVIPDEENERNSVELFKIPNVLSLLAFHDPNAEVKGLKEWPKEERPPVALSFWSFRIMVALGFLFGLLSILAFLKRRQPEASPKLLKVLIWNIPLPYIAAQAGWMLAEVGRQPWIVYGLMKTKDAVSPLSAVQVGLSLPAFIIVYGILGIICFWLIAHHARKGPEPVEALSEKPATETL